MTLSVTAGGGGSTVEITPSITMPENITLLAGDELSGITAKNAGYIYFVKSGEKATSYEDLENLKNNDSAKKLYYMSLNPEDKIDIDLGVGVYDIYVVNVDNQLIVKSDKTVTITSRITSYNVCYTKLLRLGCRQAVGQRTLTPSSLGSNPSTPASPKGFAPKHIRSLRLAVRNNFV